MNLKFPLKKQILLFLEGNVELNCIIKYAGKDTLICENVKQLIYENGESYYGELFDNEIILDRSKVLGYTNVKQEYDYKPKLQIIK